MGLVERDEPVDGAFSMDPAQTMHQNVKLARIVTHNRQFLGETVVQYTS